MIFRLPNLLDLINKEADMNVEIEPNQIVYRENGRTVVDALAAHTVAQEWKKSSKKGTSAPYDRDTAVLLSDIVNNFLHNLAPENL